MSEFAELVIGNLTLSPVCVDVVVEKQTTPAQKLSLALAFVCGTIVKAILKCFVKAEAYPDVKDPRNISQYNNRDKLTMAQFALALSGHLKKFAWYGPGKTPIEVATRVTEICSTAKFVNVSDYHRMDGTISYLLRRVDRAVFMKAFKHHHEQLNKLFDSNCDNVGILPYGTRFEQGSSHGSGCSATSVSQTLRAAFTAYLGFRNAYDSNGERYTPESAFTALGIHLGDDGLDADLSIESHQWAATKVGLVLEAGVVQRNQRGVTFLARYYSPNVWSGCPDSMCDVKRQLAKFHTTVRLPDNVKPETKLVEKAMGYYATDANTPVIGPLCKRATELIQLGKDEPTHGVGPWWSKFDHSVQFPNDNTDGWMDAEFSFQFPEFDHKIFGDWIASTESAADLLRAPLCAEPKPATPAKVDVVVDEDVVPAKVEAPKQETEQPTPKESKDVTPAAKPSRKPRAATPKVGRPKSKGNKPLASKPVEPKSPPASKPKASKYVAKTAAKEQPTS